MEQGRNEASKRPQANPRSIDPFAPGIDRRRLLRSFAAVGTTAAVPDSSPDHGGDRNPTVYVFNTGDRTVSIIDAEDDELLESVFVGTTASFPANQYGTSADSDYETLWLTVEGGVRGLDRHTLAEVAHVETNFGPNYPNITPDENHLLVAAGGTTSMAPEPDPDSDAPESHALFRIDADRNSDTFGDVTGTIDVGYAGPCDVTLEPSGEYAFVTDVANETLSVVSVDPFEIAVRIPVGDPAGDGRVLPFMCTAAFDGRYLLVENGEGELGSDPRTPRAGSESIWDVSEPTNPVELERITRDDGLPAPPLTSEIDPDSEAAYVFTPDAETVTVIDLEERTIDRELDVGGEAIAGAWGPSREKLYVPVQTANHVAVIDRNRRAVIDTIEAGAAPTGAVGGMIRPDTNATQRIRSSLASLGLVVGGRETTSCPADNCHCG